MLTKPITNRKTKKFCPVCGREKLIAAEIADGTVTHYECPFCGERFDTIVHVGKNGETPWRLGFLRNPQFWTEQNDDIESDVAEMNRKLQSGIPEYFGIYPMERLYPDKP
ncbi:MAG: hypothetical protein WCS77_10790 [Elusimicrobiaceae bacterium]